MSSCASALVRVLLLAGTGGLGACSALMPLGSRTADVPRSMLSAVPCLNDAIRSTFGTQPTQEGSHRKAERNELPHLRQTIEVRLDPSDSGRSTGPARRVFYTLSHLGPDAVRVRYWVDLPGALRDEWMEQAFLPLEQCGATPR